MELLLLSLGSPWAPRFSIWAQVAYTGKLARYMVDNDRLSTCFLSTVHGNCSVG